MVKELGCKNSKYGVWLAWGHTKLTITCGFESMYLVYEIHDIMLQDVFSFWLSQIHKSAENVYDTILSKIINSGFQKLYRTIVLYVDIHMYTFPKIIIQ